MSDLGKLDIGDWLGLAVVSVGAGMGSAMAWFSKSNKGRDDRIEEIGKKVEQYKDLIIAQALELAVLKTCQANISVQLDEIKCSVSDTAERGAHSVNTQIALMINELQQLSADVKRRPN